MLVKLTVGVFFGHVCPGKSGFEPLPGQGCSSNVIKIGERSSTVAFKISYDILFTVKSTNPGRIVLLLDFSQPVNASTVIISGSVGNFNNNPVISNRALQNWIIFVNS